MSENDYGGSGGRSTLMVDGWKMAALQEIPDRHKTTELVREHVLRRLAAVERSWTCSDWFRMIRGACGGCHSPFLDQKDGYQHQQYKDEDAGADPSDLHHPICLFSRIRDDFRLLCGTYWHSEHMNTALPHGELLIKSSYSTRFV